MFRNIICKASSTIKGFSTQLPKMAEGNGKNLQSVVEALEKFAPLSGAESWDNVGLLIEPHKKRTIKKIILTNDLTESVMHESTTKNIDMIVSYHPPIFAPLKRITQSDWKQRIVSICLSESIALYSPHTAWDAIKGGVNDWLALALPYSDIAPIKPNPDLPEGSGTGRILSTNITLEEAIVAVQKHIGLDVHVALGSGHNLSTPIKRVALCVGSGASVLKDVEADLLLTGEMSHHEVLDANHRQKSVILCNHSNSERGFLHTFQKHLHKMLNSECEIVIADTDMDPLRTFVHPLKNTKNM